MSSSCAVAPVRYPPPGCRAEAKLSTAIEEGEVEEEEEARRADAAEVVSGVTEIRVVCAAGYVVFASRCVEAGS